MIKNNISLSILVLFIISCDNNNNIDDEQFRYPLNIGNRWEYRREWISYSYPDSTLIDSLIAVRSGQDSCSIIVVQETTILDSIETVQLMEQAWEDSTVIVGLYYYQERDTGLFYLAYQRPYLNAHPKQVSMEAPLFEPLMPNHLKKVLVSELSKVNSTSKIYYIDPPVYVLKYPLERGSNWVYRYQPWYIQKTVLSDTTVILECGTFDCYKIRMTYKYSNTEVIIDDFIADEGLVLRKILSKGYAYDSLYNYIYTVWDDEYRLMSYDIDE